MTKLFTWVLLLGVILVLSQARRSSEEDERRNNHRDNSRRDQRSRSESKAAEELARKIKSDLEKQKREERDRERQLQDVRRAIRESITDRIGENIANKLARIIVNKGGDDSKEEDSREGGTSLETTINSNVIDLVRQIKSKVLDKLTSRKDFLRSSFRDKLDTLKKALRNVELFEDKVQEKRNEDESVDEDVSVEDTSTSLPDDLEKAIEAAIQCEIDQTEEASVSERTPIGSLLVLQLVRGFEGKIDELRSAWRDFMNAKKEMVEKAKLMNLGFNFEKLRVYKESLQEMLSKKKKFVESKIELKRYILETLNNMSKTYRSRTGKAFSYTDFLESVLNATIHFPKALEDFFKDVICRKVVPARNGSQEAEISGSDAPPAISGSDAPAAISESDAPAAISGSDAPAAVSGSDAPPAISESDAPPAVSASDAPPAISASDAAPETSDTDALPTPVSTISSDQEKLAEDIIADIINIVNGIKENVADKVSALKEFIQSNIQPKLDKLKETIENFLLDEKEDEAGNRRKRSTEDSEVPPANAEESATEEAVAETPKEPEEIPAEVLTSIERAINSMVSGSVAIAPTANEAILDGLIQELLKPFDADIQALQELKQKFDEAQANLLSNVASLRTASDDVKNVSDIFSKLTQLPIKFTQLKALRNQYQAEKTKVFTEVTDSLKSLSASYQERTGSPVSYIDVLTSLKNSSIPLPPVLNDYYTDLSSVASAEGLRMDVVPPKERNDSSEGSSSVVAVSVVGVLVAVVVTMGISAMVWRHRRRQRLYTKIPN